MEVGDSGFVDGVVPEGKTDDGIEGIDHHDKEDGTDQVEIEMDHGGPLGVFIGAQGGQQGGDAGTDVLAHDDGDGSGIGDGAGGGHGLENTHRSGRTLDDAGDHQAHQNAQDGVGEQGEHILGTRAGPGGK